MAGNVIRQDTVKISFDIDLGPLTKVSGEVDKLKKSIGGGVGGDAFDDLKKEANEASKGLDKVDKSAEDVGKELDNVENKSGKAFNGLKKLASLSFKALAVGISAATTAATALVTQSVKGYANYEQLVGGVDTLFKDSSSVVQKNADKAFKTSGLSANAYMETVTGFSASLIQSVGGDTAEAARLADMAITDMSDNANKMGTSMESIQYAYQGFAKQNYTMLDNLKLGYGGTKTEMERLVKDAAKIDKSIDANSLSYANIVKAINVVQKEMGIYGTTAEEADKTITGSLNSMKAAWNNTLVSLVKGGDDFDKCVDNLIASALTFKDNIMPAIEKALSGLGTLITELAPELEKHFPVLVQELLPPLIKAATSLLSALIKALPSIVKIVIAELPNILKEVGIAIAEAFGMPADKAKKLGDTFGSIGGAIGKCLPAILGIAAAFTLLSKFKSIKKIFSGFSKGTEEVGEATSKNASQMSAAAKSFLAIGASVLMIAISFGILTACAINLANAGPLAIGVMFGLVVALVALGIGMMIMLKSLSSVGSQVMPAAISMLMLGAAVILIAVGLGILTIAAIALANAGWGAIAVLAGMIVIVALLAVVVATLGTAMIAGSIGFAIFGAAVLMVGAGFMLMGVGALLAATSLVVLSSALPVLSQYALSGALALMVLSAGLTVYAIGAALAGAASLILGAGLLVVAAALLLMVVPLTLIVAMFTVMCVMGLLFAAAMALLAPAFALAAASAPLFASAIKPLNGKFLKLAVSTALLAAAFIPLAAAFALASAGALLLLASLLLIPSAIKNIQKQFNNAKLFNAGMQMINGLIKGMNSKKAAAVSTARSIAQAINKEYRKIQDIHSPSGEWYDYGGYQIQGDINGMKDKLPQLKSTVQEVGKVSMPYSGEYTPENSSVYNNSRSDEYNTYSPSFNLTISGSNDDRILSRKVKRWINEAMNETFESLERKNPKLMEV